MGSRARCAVFVAAVALAADAAGAPRLTVGPVEGDRAAALPTQLATALCVRFECVLWTSIAVRGRPDEAKVRAAGVAGVLIGAVDRREEPVAVALSLLVGPPPAVQAWRFPLTAGGRLSAEDLRRLEADLAARLAPAAKAARPPAAKPAPAPKPRPAAPPPAPAAPPRVAPPERVVAPPPPPAPPSAAPAVVVPPPAAAPVAEGAPSGRWLAEAELGGFWARRSLTYGGVGASTSVLRGFEADGVRGLRLHLGVHPLAHLPGPWLGGLGLSVDYARALGLETEAPTGEARSTEFTSLRVGLLWRSPPLWSPGLVVVPSVAWVTRKVVVSPAIDGLPDGDLAGLRLGVAAELPFAGRLRALGGLGYVRWTSAKDLVGGAPAYFPGGSASALEGELGLEVAVHGPWAARLVVEHSRTRYALDPDPSGAYSASSALDAVTEARLVARATY